MSKNNNTKPKKIKPVKLPKKLDKPFFAYGIFKKDQLAFSKIKDYVRGNPMDKSINRKMLMRDGIPLILDKDSKHYKTQGNLIYFRENYEKKAYERICKTEPDILYKWDVVKIDEVEANVLVGLDVHTGSHTIDDINEFNFKGENDAYFKELMYILDKFVNNLEKTDDYNSEYNIFDIFKFQMYYLMLWSSIERYCSLKYDGANSINKNNEFFSKEDIFEESLKRNVNRKNKKIYSTKDIEEYKLDVNDPKQSIKYYYTIRCNAVHRGKSAKVDTQILKESLIELYKIFRDVLEDTFGINYIEVFEDLKKDLTKKGIVI